MIRGNFRSLGFQWLEPRLALAVTLPAGFVNSTVATGLNAPTAMEVAPDGRIFVAQQDGALRVIENGQLLTTPFLSLNVDSSGERGLLGVAFDPNFASNHSVYVYYTVPGATAHNRVSRFTANGDVAVAGSEVPILDLDNLSSATNHNGGAIHFGLDGKLYIGVGENANGANSQTLSNRLGKMLRINPDGSIPTDNPFFNTATGANRAIWAIGLRNPFSFAVQPGTGRIFINDVGQSTWEEIDDGIAGSNYGWPNAEGFANNPAFRDPLFEYGHGTSNTTGSAITGGTFYNPPLDQFGSSYTGKYFFSDLTSGWIRVFDPATNTASDFATGLNLLVDLKVDASGNLLYLDRTIGAVDRIQQTAFSQNGNTLSVTGTAANDQLLINFTDNDHVQVTFNGTTQAYSSVQVTAIQFNGMGGADSSVVYGNMSLAYVNLAPGTGTISTPRIAITLLASATNYVYATSGSAAIVGAASGNLASLTPLYTSNSSQGSTNFVVGVPVTVTSSGAAGDAAFVYSASSDTFVATPGYSYLSTPDHGTPAFAVGFPIVYAYNGGGTNETSYFYAATSGDSFTATPGSGVLSGTTGQNHTAYYLAAIGFLTNYAIGQGGNAFLNDTTASAVFIGTSSYSTLAVAGSFFSEALNFGNVLASSTKGTSMAWLYDGAGANAFAGTGSDAQLILSRPALLDASGFAQVNAVRSQGSTNTRHVGAIDYALTFYGNWQSI